MAILYMDGFDQSDYAQRWAVIGASVPTIVLETGRFGSGKALKLSTSIGNIGGISRAMPSTSIAYFGAAVRIDATPTSSNDLLFGIPIPGGAGGNMGLWLTPGGTIILVRQSGFQGPLTDVSATVIATATETYSVGQWMYIEVQYYPDTAAGRFVLKKNGSVIIDYTGNTRSMSTITGSDSYILAGGKSGRTIAWDDVYVADTSGSTNNTFLGDIEVKLLSPNGNGNYSQFTGSDGNSVDNYDLINDDVLTDYVQASVVGSKDSYTLDDVSGVDVRAVQSVVRGAQTGGGAAAVKPFLRIGGTDYQGATQYLGQQTVGMHIYNTNPATAGVWTEAALNGAELGVEVV